MIFTVAMIGTARNAPAIPHRNHQNTTTNRTATGLSLSLLP